MVAAKSGVLARDYATNLVRGDVVEGAPAFVNPITLYATLQHQRGAGRRQIAIQRNQQNRSEGKPTDYPEGDAANPSQHAADVIGPARRGLSVTTVRRKVRITYPA